jgi:hypothetical protein
MKKMFFGLLFIFISSFLVAADLTEGQLWAIRLTGIMTELNRSNHNTLNSFRMSSRNKNRVLEMLKREWEITNKDELLETLKEVENYGHASRLRLIQQIINEEIISMALGNEENVIVITNVDTYDLTYWQYNSLRYAISNWDSYRNRSILAWDLGRIVALCRWGYDAGFFTENEAWEKIMYYARLIQPLYNSWEEYGYDYLMGRVFWASGFGESARYYDVTFPIYGRLIKINGHWYNKEWNVNLIE